jgi:hypothetical protein
MVYIKVNKIIEKDGTIHIVRSSRLSEFLEKVKPNVVSCYPCVSHIVVPHLRTWKWRSLYVENFYIDSYEEGSF